MSEEDDPPQKVRIISLLGAATDIIFRLKCENLLVGRSHECTYPPEVLSLPCVSNAEPILESNRKINSREISENVKKLVENGMARYKVDGAKMKELQPDVIILQDACSVCAVSVSDLESACTEFLHNNSKTVKVVALKPQTADDVFANVLSIAEALGVPLRGRALQKTLLQEWQTLKRSTPQWLDGMPPLDVACLQWLDPLIGAGFWVPQIISCAGGKNLFGSPGGESPIINFENLKSANPDVIVIMCCGWNIEKTRQEIETIFARIEQEMRENSRKIGQEMSERPESLGEKSEINFGKLAENWATLRAVKAGRVYIVDGGKYFNSSSAGTMVESAKLMGEILHGKRAGYEGNAFIRWIPSADPPKAPLSTPQEQKSKSKSTSPREVPAGPDEPSSSENLGKKKQKLPKWLLDGSSKQTLTGDLPPRSRRGTRNLENQEGKKTPPPPPPSSSDPPPSGPGFHEINIGYTPPILGGSDSEGGSSDEEAFWELSVNVDVNRPMGVGAFTPESSPRGNHANLEQRDDETNQSLQRSSSCSSLDEAVQGAMIRWYSGELDPDSLVLAAGFDNHPIETPPKKTPPKRTPLKEEVSLEGEEGVVVKRTVWTEAVKSKSETKAKIETRPDDSDSDEEVVKEARALAAAMRAKGSPSPRGKSLGKVIKKKKSPRNSEKRTDLAELINEGEAILTGSKRKLFPGKNLREINLKDIVQQEDSRKIIIDSSEKIGTLCSRDIPVQTANTEEESIFLGGVNFPPLTNKAGELREVLEKAVAEALPADCIVLSGGLDTGVLAEIAASQGGVNLAFTVLATPEATDRHYAEKTAKRCKLEHIVLGHDLEQLLSEELEFVISILETFDPMEVRNSLPIAASLREAAKRGCKSAITGDGADELLGGYSFTHNMAPEKFEEYRKHLRNVMKFASKTLGKALWIDVRQPYLNSEFIDFAMESLSHADLIGIPKFSADVITKIETNCCENDVINTLHGKLALREAFPGVYAAWRTKDPIEVGSGTTVLPTYFQQQISPEEFNSRKSEILITDQVVIRDPEHLYYYEKFKKVFKNEVPPGRVRFKSDACISCGYQLQTPLQTFCVVCGAYPARKSEQNISEIGERSPEPGEECGESAEPEEEIAKISKLPENLEIQKLAENSKVRKLPENSKIRKLPDPDLKKLKDVEDNISQTGERERNSRPEEEMCVALSAAELHALCWDEEPQEESEVSECWDEEPQEESEVSDDEEDEYDVLQKKSSKKRFLGLGLLAAVGYGLLRVLQKK